MDNLILTREELMSIDGGVNAGLIWTGVVGIAGGVVACCSPGGQLGGAIAIYGGAVTLVAGLVY